MRQRSSFSWHPEFLIVFRASKEVRFSLSIMLQTGHLLLSLSHSLRQSKWNTWHLSNCNWLAAEYWLSRMPALELLLRIMPPILRLGAVLGEASKILVLLPPLNIRLVLLIGMPLITQGRYETNWPLSSSMKQKLQLTRPGKDDDPNVFRLLLMLPVLLSCLISAPS